MWERNKKLKEKYPHIELSGRRINLFFGEEEYKEDFKSRMIDHGGGDTDYDPKVLGEYLLYPPSALEWFVESRLNKDIEGERAKLITYKGIGFITRDDLVGENITWMENNYIAPEMEFEKYAIVVTSK